jgi:hypothetical protein
MKTDATPISTPSKQHRHHKHSSSIALSMAGVAISSPSRSRRSSPVKGSAKTPIKTSTMSPTKKTPTKAPKKTPAKTPKGSASKTTTTPSSATIMITPANYDPEKYWNLPTPDRQALTSDMEPPQFQNGWQQIDHRLSASRSAYDGLILARVRESPAHGNGSRS